MRDWDYGYVEYFRKAAEIAEANRPLCSSPHCLSRAEVIDENLRCFNQSCRIQYVYNTIFKGAEIDRDFFAGSLKEIKHLIQFDKKPNSDLKSPLVELYKISVTFSYFGKCQVSGLINVDSLMQ